MLTALDKLTDDALIRLSAVRTVVPYCKSSIYQKIERKEFPAPVKLGTRASGWRVRDIKEWLNNPTGWKAADHS
jgi:prophage regulatory protein